ncbi:flavin reductase family protein [Alicyclobacillus mengziensis]|uniref:Flavin reductase family protein n=1 Tax=Alicyclobacillus mengziensis TaxID=2931921 RepID=A0A9X7Z7L5_9BACL|nr:flavin reductase family protein [Alicyclobacillus mengziensis]QSO49204.1 flavin reductase family protein [Alicyclobacillus mengziensis]
MNKRLDESVRTRIVHPKILYFGTPVVLLTTLNEDGTSNITPMSSAWALGNRIILGLGEGGHGLTNLRQHGECVVNMPDPSLWKKVEALAPFTGANPVPNHKKGVFRHAKDKFAESGLTAIESHRVLPTRIAECPLQIEAKVVDIRTTGEGTRFGIIEVEALMVHAYHRIVVDESHIDPVTWSPLIYNFRHYFGLGEELGKTFRAEV